MSTLQANNSANPVISFVLSTTLSNPCGLFRKSHQFKHSPPNVRLSAWCSNTIAFWRVRAYTSMCSACNKRRLTPLKHICSLSQSVINPTSIKVNRIRIWFSLKCAPNFNTMFIFISASEIFQHYRIINRFRIGLKWKVYILKPHFFCVVWLSFFFALIDWIQWRNKVEIPKLNTSLPPSIIH